MNKKKYAGPKLKERIVTEPILTDPEILISVHKELSSMHIGDDMEKLNAFIVASTAYLSEAANRKSICLKAASSEGKDNLIRSVLRLFPQQDWILVTHATQAALQDDTAQYKIIAVSEVNLQKDDKGANCHLLETLKQMTEGGTSAFKKDIASGLKLVKHVRQEQKTVLYSTTETADDEELSTRFIVASLRSTPQKIKEVHNHTLDIFGGKKKIMEESSLTKAIECLTNGDVIIPFYEELKNLDIFDAQHPRSMRDIKRFLACVCAVAWLHQKQRGLDEEGRVLAEPYDFMAAMLVCGPFFNHTYSGLGDQRLQQFLDLMNEYCDARLGDDRDIFPRNKIQEKMSVSLNTIKALSKGCSNLSIIRFEYKDASSKIFYRRLKRGIEKNLFKVGWRGMLEHFKKMPSVSLPENIEAALIKLEGLKKKGDKPPVIRPETAEEETIHHKCAYCQASPCVAFNTKGEPVCRECKEHPQIKIAEEIIR